VSVIRGTGRQTVGAVVLLVSYYVVALPLGISLMFATSLQLTGSQPRILSITPPVGEWSIVTGMSAWRVMSLRPCCVVLVASCLRQRRAPTPDESIVQGVPGWCLHHCLVVFFTLSNFVQVLKVLTGFENATQLLTR